MRLLLRRKLRRQRRLQLHRLASRQRRRRREPGRFRRRRRPRIRLAGNRRVEFLHPACRRSALRRGRLLHRSVQLAATTLAGPDGGAGGWSRELPAAGARACSTAFSTPPQRRRRRRRGFQGRRYVEPPHQERNRRNRRPLGCSVVAASRRELETTSDDQHRPVDRQNAVRARSIPCGPASTPKRTSTRRRRSADRGDQDGTQRTQRDPRQFQRGHRAPDRRSRQPTASSGLRVRCAVRSPRR